VQKKKKKNTAEHSTVTSDRENLILCDDIENYANAAFG